LPDASGSLPQLATIQSIDGGPELKSARLLATGAEVAWRPAGELIEIEVSEPINGSPTQVIELTYRDSVMGLKPIALR
jgi:hypothetical protein